MFKRWQQMRQDDAERWVALARQSPMSDPSVDYPEWYLHRWHFLPEGYLWSRSVRLYEQRVRHVYNAFNERAVLRLVRGFLRRSGASDVLEVGCGPGYALAELAGLPGAALTGIDLSPFMLDAATTRAGCARLIHADATHLPVTDASLDAVVAIHLLGHVPGAVAATIVGEVGRVLRPGGRLIVADHAWHPLPALALRPAGGARAAGGTIRVRSFSA